MSNGKNEKPKKPGDWSIIIKSRDEKQEKKQKVELAKKPSKGEK